MTMTSVRWVSLAAVATVAGIGCGGPGPGPGVASGTGGSQTITTGLCDDSQMGARPDGPVGAMPTPGKSAFPPVIGATVHQDMAPPAISGGTLRVLPDGMTAVAADPDRDQVYLVDLSARAVRAVVPLAAGDEPGRVVADAAGRAHVALRRGGALVTIDTTTGALLARRAVCAAPRGAAYDAANDLVHVACADGRLVSLPAAGGDAVRTLTLAPDLRDVVVDGPRLRVSRFRTAEVLTVEADGSVPSRALIPAFRSPAARSGGLFTAGVAWKMEAMPEGGVMMLHQRGVVDEVMPAPGGYGSFDPCGAIVHPAVTAIDADGAMRSGPALAGMVLAVDMAISGDGKRVAFVSAGNATNQMPGDTGPDLSRVFLTDVDDVTDTTIGCQPDGMHGPCPAKFGVDRLLQGAAPPDGTDPSEPAADLAPTAPPAMTGTGGSTGVSPDPTCDVPDPEVPPQVGQPIAVAFYGADQLVVQSREPAMLAFADGRNVTLSTVSREDTGHLVFHANAGGFLACASCHAEGNDDGRTWTFTCQGPRRTQSLQTGLRGTEPFHWSGDQPDFSHLMNDVFVGRMSGPFLPADQGEALLTWIDAQPRPARPAPADAAAVERGRAIFTDTQHAACSACHLPGASFTNHVTVDVGTGGAFQVPSLIGIGSRGPYMHNGCAKTLRDRLTDASCGGGDKHGKTSDLTSAQISDLLAFLESI